MFAEDFTYRQLDGVIINPGRSGDYGIRTPTTRPAQTRSRPNVGSRRRIVGCLPDVHWTSWRICLHYGLQRYSSPNRRTFLSTLTVDTASSYGALISWQGDKLALIGLDDPVITVSFFDEIPLNPDRRWSDNRECIAYKSFIRITTLDFFYTSRVFFFLHILY